MTEKNTPTGAYSTFRGGKLGLGGAKRNIREYREKKN